MQEEKKADNRRKLEVITRAGFKWDDVLFGKCIDIGCGDNPISWPNMDVLPFDMQDGDATKLSDYFPEETFDTINASQIIEDFDDIPMAISSIVKTLKVGGHLVITVPDFTLYEQLHWPPMFNCGHRNTFSLTLPGSPAGDRHWLVGGDRWESLMSGNGLETILTRLVDTNYDYSKLGSKIDQTLKFEDGVECFIETVLVKL
ncbi:MAG: methyltransferase domain-containing protein [Verrucomicrobiota bacterium]